MVGCGVYVAREPPRVKPRSVYATYASVRHAFCRTSDAYVTTWMLRLRRKSSPTLVVARRAYATQVAAVVMQARDGIWRLRHKMPRSTKTGLDFRSGRATHWGLVAKCVV